MIKDHEHFFAHTSNCLGVLCPAPDGTGYDVYGPNLQNPERIGKLGRWLAFGPRGNGPVFHSHLRRLEEAKEVVYIILIEAEAACPRVAHALCITRKEAFDLCAPPPGESGVTITA